MKTNQILGRVSEVIDAALNDSNFFSNNVDSLIATGERTVDYSAYCIEIDKDNFLILDFVDFVLDNFSIINKEHIELVINSLEK